jgi:hypothetical protein
MKKNTIVAVTFLDHVESGKEAKPERFTVYGRLVSVSARALVVASWAYASQRRVCDDNSTTYTILRSCIERVETLEAKG